MSIALHAKVKELERRVIELEQRRCLCDKCKPVVFPTADIEPVKRKPGRPPKNG